MKRYLNDAGKLSVECVYDETSDTNHLSFFRKQKNGKVERVFEAFVRTYSLYDLAEIVDDAIKEREAAIRKAREQFSL
jgi:hypothetical protein